MEQNHDALKAALTQRLQKFGKWAVRITWVAAIWEILRFLAEISSYRQLIELNGDSPAEAASFALANLLQQFENGYFWTEVFPSKLLLLIVFVLSVILYRRIRRDGIPFSLENVRLLRICGILMGIRALIPSVWLFITDPQGFITGDWMRTGIEKDPSLWFCVILFLCAEFMYYGAALQKESDETL